MLNKILVVDDTNADLTNIKNVVYEAGYVVVAANSGLEAVNKAKSEKPDLIFMDVVMDGMDGYEACRKLKEDPDTKAIPVVFVTSKNQKADKVWAELQGGEAFITKPFSSQQIVDQINEIETKKAS